MFHDIILNHCFWFLLQLLDMVEKNEINRSLLTLLDENIANAYRGNQVSRPGGWLNWQKNMVMVFLKKKKHGYGSNFDFKLIRKSLIELTEARHKCIINVLNRTKPNSKQIRSLLVAWTLEKYLCWINRNKIRL